VEIILTDKLFADHPISHPKDDAFGLSSFADALATSLLKMSPADGLVISVEGPWGSGKSSAIALTTRTIKLRVLIGLGEGQDELEKLTNDELDEKWEEKAKARNTHIVRFNPWNFSGQENLVRAFFGELAAQIDSEPEGKLKKAMNRFAGYLPSTLGAVAAGAALATGNVPVASGVKSPERVRRALYRQVGSSLRVRLWYGEKYYNINQHQHKSQQEAPTWTSQFITILNAARRAIRLRPLRPPDIGLSLSIILKRAGRSRSSLACSPLQA